MFWTYDSFNLDFDPDSHLQPSERQIYAVRAKVAKERYVWSDSLMPVFKNCLIHRSANVPGKVAYYASIPNMVANRITRTSPEMFLKRALAIAPGEIQGAWIAEVMGQTLPTLHFIENDDPEGWYEVYKQGPHSCMKHSSRVRQYACPQNNLALVFSTKDNDPEDEILYRVIVNKARKTYLRIYGDEDDKNYFVAALHKAGYKQSGDTLRDEYVNLAFEPCDRCGCNTLVGPYFDGCWDRVESIGNGVGRIADNGDPMNYSNEAIFCGCSDDESNDY
jgi:hypothetical protein